MGLQQYTGRGTIRDALPRDDQYDANTGGSGRYGRDGTERTRCPPRTPDRYHPLLWMDVLGCYSARTTGPREDPQST